MADQLYLSLWYPNFRLEGLPGALVSVLRQLAAAGGASGVTAASVYPISWQEAPAFQRLYRGTDVGAAPPEEAVAQATEMLHDDFAYEFEVQWDLWAPESDAGLDTLWREQPRPVRVLGYGPEFDQGAYEQNGHIRIDLGPDTPFVQEEVALDREAAGRVQANIAKLIAVTHAIQANTPVSSRLLWSESGESLASKLIARLQRLN